MKKTQKKTSESRGTDDPFYKLMHAGGPALLKLIGITSPESYRPEAIVLKEKKLYPDIVAMPDNKGDRVFIEFQGYNDAMIRYSLCAKITGYCARNNYTGPVFGVIIYTEKPFKEAALSLDIKSESGLFQISGQFREIVLSDYTEQKLKDIDHRLIVLAPFTLPKTMKKEKLASVCRKWKKIVETVYEEDRYHESLEILGLFILNRFRKLSLKEVYAMLNLNLEKTKAGKELVSMGVEIGEKKGKKEGKKEGEKKGKREGKKEGSLLKAREMLICTIEEKFGNVPESVLSAIKRISKEPFLNDLFRKALRCQTLDEFTKDLG